MNMTTKIRKWGNSYAIRLPKDMVVRHGYKEGSRIQITDKDSTIQIRPIQKKYSLKELISQIDPKNLPELVDWGPDVGNEILPPWED